MSMTELPQLDHLCDACGGTKCVEVTCDRCKGKGGDACHWEDCDGTNALPCGECDGKGYVLTDAGRAVLEFMKRHLPVERVTEVESNA